MARLYIAPLSDPLWLKMSWNLDIAIPDKLVNSSILENWRLDPLDRT
ncbi:MAG: hypothetical protein RIM23_00200 [Coleofasciculus sp. G3-WIS-01]